MGGMGESGGSPMRGNVCFFVSGLELGVVVIAAGSGGNYDNL